MEGDNTEEKGGIEIDLKFPEKINLSDSIQEMKWAINYGICTTQPRLCK